VNLYLASSSKNIPAARAAMQKLREAGHVITYDWTLDAEDPDPNKAPNYFAAKCIQGVEQADCLIFLHSDFPTAGAWWEFGYAYGLDRPIYTILGEGRTLNEFESLIFLSSWAVRHYQTVEILLKWAPWKGQASVQEVEF
jgi:nucleoside 2-deoxyribosyltransferase